MTPTQEKYLLVIDKLSKDKKLVRNRQVADILEVKPSSVTEIMDRLVNQNMIQHISYQGVFLTSSGEEQVALLKERRLILSTFLTSYLGISRTEAPEIINEPDVPASYIWEINTEEEGTPEQTKRVVDQLEDTNVKSLFVETSVNPSPMQSVSQDSGIPIYSEIFTDSVAEPGEEGDSYYAMMKWNIDKIHEGLTQE